MITSNCVPEQQAFSIQEFCSRNRISLSTFHKLKSQDRGPRLMAMGRLIRISIEAEKDWRAAREMPDDAEQRLIKREAAARSLAGKHAGRIAAESPRHFCRRKIHRTGANK